MKNNKGFTLIELLVTILLLTLVMSIGAFSIINILEKQKTNEYNLLLKNIKDASETYYHECKYHDDDSNITCNLGEVDLLKLVKYGFLKSNNNGSISDPRNNKKNFNDCVISIIYQDGSIVLTSVSGNCPEF